MNLNCSDFDSAVNSVALIFNTVQSTLISALKNTNDLNKEEIYDFIRQELGQPKNNYQVVWFHVSRAESNSQFEKYGILPTSQARTFLEPCLEELAKDLVKKGEGPYAGCLTDKEMINDEGPYAFLIRDAAIHSKFLERPEFVTDFANEKLGENYGLLVNRFKEITNPYIVSFVVKPKGNELVEALYFLHLVITGEEIISAASDTRAYYNARGCVISSDSIESVELIEK